MNCYFSPLTPDFPQVGEGRLGIIESLIANAPFFFIQLSPQSTCIIALK